MLRGETAAPWAPNAPRNGLLELFGFRSIAKVDRPIYRPHSSGWLTGVPLPAGPVTG
eukprot:COSAG02_NODE_1578_length_11853_cov_3.734048_2_plen_57_part_00